MKKIAVGIIVLIVIIGAGLFFTRKAPTSSTTTTNNQSEASPSTDQSSPNTIVFDGSQFSPASLTVKSGTTITIKNTSSKNLQFDSDPHPIHTDDSDLNVGIVAAGQSQTFTATKTGSFGYHDHLNSSLRGKITVQ